MLFFQKLDYSKRFHSFLRVLDCVCIEFFADSCNKFTVVSWIVIISLSPTLLAALFIAFCFAVWHCEGV
jgi:hypothetical protein